MSSNFSKAMIFNIGLLGAGHFFSDFYANFLPALLPLVMSKLGMSLTISGMLVMAYAVISSVLQPLAGYLIDKYGYSWLILVTTPVSAVFICVAGLAPNHWLLFLAVSIAGLGASIFHPLSACLMGKVVTPETKSRAMSVFVFGGNVGCAVAPAVILYCLSLGGTESLIWLIIPGLIVTWASYLAGLHKIDIKPAKVTAQEDCKLQREPWYKSRGIWLLNIVVALRSWMQVALTTFLPVALTASGQSTAVIASMLTVFLLSGACGSLMGGWVGDKIGRKAGFIGSLIVCLPTTFLFLQNMSPTLLSYALLAVSGALLQSTAPTSVVWAQELIPGNAAMASGMMLGLSYGLGGVGAAVTGALGDYVGLEQAMLYSILSVVAAIIIAFTIPQPVSKISAVAAFAGDTAKN